MTKEDAKQLVTAIMTGDRDHDLETLHHRYSVAQPENATQRKIREIIIEACLTRIDRLNTIESAKVELAEIDGDDL